MPLKHGTYIETALANMAKKYSNLSMTQEQRRLRIHLRHTLITKGDNVQINDKDTPQVADVSNPELNDWRHMAIEREKFRLRRHQCASIIQRCFSKWYQKQKAILIESELPSTSTFEPVYETPLLIEKSDTKPEGEIELTKPLRSDIVAPFKVSVELLGARDLSLQRNDQMVPCIDAFIQVQEKEDNNKPSTLVSAAIEVIGNDEVEWDDERLEVGIENTRTTLENGIVQAHIRSYPSLYATHNKPVPLGTATIALDLLETPLAEQFRMTRWFPLEKTTRRNGPARGEVRLCVSMLMQIDGIWRPYKPVEKTVECTAVQDVPSKAPPPPPTRLEKPNKTSAKPPLSPKRKASVNPDLHRQKVVSDVNSSVTEQDPSPPVIRGRRPSSLQIARREVISPPSSPSSYTSDQSDRSSIWSPSPRRRMLSPQTNEHPSSTPLSNKSTSTNKDIERKASNKKLVSVSSPRDRDTEVVTESTSPDKKPFLKRKPHKAVFQKLDWSTVSARTDSNWPHKSADGGHAVSSKIPLVVSPNGASESKTSSSKPSEKMSEVIKAVYEACQVTSQNAPLAQLRYRRERKAITVQPVSSAASESEDTTDLITETYLQQLWQHLCHDHEGRLYVQKLTNMKLDNISSLN